jgi:hypothetical protein
VQTVRVPYTVRVKKNVRVPVVYATVRVPVERRVCQVLEETVRVSVETVKAPVAIFGFP